MGASFRKARAMPIALALPAREPGAALAHDGVVALRQAPDEAVAGGRPGCGEHRRVVGLGPGEADVLHHAPVQEADLLGYHRQGVAQGILGDGR